MLRILHRSLVTIENHTRVNPKNNILEITDALNEFSEKHDLIKKTFECCNKSIDNCIKDELEIGIEPLGGVIRENIRIKFHSQFLINSSEWRYVPCIKTRLHLFDCKGLEQFDDTDYIGYYEYDVDENGNCFDDWFVLEN